MSHFLGQVLEVHGSADGVKITFVKRQPGTNNLFTFPAKEDIDVVPYEDIVDTLQKEPVMNNRQQFVVNYEKYHLK